MRQVDMIGQLPILVVRSAFKAKPPTPPPPADPDERLHLMADTATETEHRWFEYGRWFYGQPSSFDDHVCNTDGMVCQFRTRTVTRSDWGAWRNKTPASTPRPHTATSQARE